MRSPLIPEVALPEVAPREVPDVRSAPADPKHLGQVLVQHRGGFGESWVLAAHPEEASARSGKKAWLPSWVFVFKRRWKAYASPQQTPEEVAGAVQSHIITLEIETPREVGVGGRQMGAGWGAPPRRNNSDEPGAHGRSTVRS